MSEIETLGILEEIQSLVSDHLQVVSYKWLSRNFLVSSNAAKKLLQEFVKKHEDELQVIYTVAGWLKKSPQTYHIRLVSMPKLAEVKHDFDGNCSVQVYSVQACIPKDPAAIWNIEFIQAEELYKQPATVDNCFRDNRFCGVSNSLVKRNAEGAPSAATASQAKGVGTSGQAATSSANKTTAIPLQQHNNLQQPSPKLDPPASDTTSVRSATDKSGTCDLRKEADKAKIAAATKKKGQSDKSTAGNGSSLANLWGRASSKSKSTHSSDQPKCAAQNNNSADAQIRARETLEAVSSDDDDESDVNFKRASNGDGVKKRRVVFDDSDEDDYENAVNLGSPDPPTVKSCQDTKQKNRALNTEHKTLNFNEREESKPTVKEEKPINLEPMVKDKAITVESEVKKEKASVAEPAVKKEKETNGDPFEESFSALGKAKNTRTPTSEGIPVRTADSSTSNKNKAASTASGSPKRRKVLKTRIDERGREVTEVVWEGEEADMKDKNAGKSGNNNVKSPNGTTVNAEDNAAKIPANRAPMTKKSPAATNAVPSHTTGKAGGKKGPNAKDPKQGNIMSFFKKKV